MKMDRVAIVCITVLLAITAGHCKYMQLHVAMAPCTLNSLSSNSYSTKIKTDVL